MKPTAFWWSQRDFETFITRWAVPRDVDLQVLCECAPFASVFAFSWPLSSCYSLERVCPEGLRSPVSPSPIRMSHIAAVSVHLRSSILATLSPPFHLRLWATDTNSFVLVLFLIWAFVSLSAAPYNMQYSSFHFPLESLREWPCLSAV